MVIAQILTLDSESHLEERQAFLKMLMPKFQDIDV